jgi:hypothetical protein
LTIGIRGEHSIEEEIDLNKNLPINYPIILKTNSYGQFGDQPITIFSNTPRLNDKNNIEIEEEDGKGIDAELLRVEEQANAKEEHFKTPSKSKEPIICVVCGADLTGKGQLTKNGKFYCAQPGCGYPERGDLERRFGLTHEEAST